MVFNCDCCYEDFDSDPYNINGKGNYCGKCINEMIKSDAILGTEEVEE